MEIKIDKDTLEKAVTQAIVESSIGDVIRAALRERFQDYKLKDAIGKVVDQQIAVIVRDLLTQDENRARLRSEIKAQLTDAMVTEIVGKATAKIWEGVG